jgi:hypothetical protein
LFRGALAIAHARSGDHLEVAVACADMQIRNEAKPGEIATTFTETDSVEILGGQVRGGIWKTGLEKLQQGWPPKAPKPTEGPLRCRSACSVARCSLATCGLDEPYDHRESRSLI